MKSYQNEDYPYFEDEMIDDEEYINVGALLEDLIRGFFHHWFIICLISFALAAGLYFHAKRSYVPIYQSSVSILVDANYAVGKDSEDTALNTMWRIATTFPYIISNDALRTMIADDIGMSYVPGKITAEAVPDTNLIRIKVLADEPQLAYDILQSVIKNYPNVAKTVIGNTNMTIVEEPEVPTDPVNWVEGKKMALLGATAGFCLCMGVIFILSILKKTIREEDDFESYFNIRSFGCIPLAKDKKIRRKQENVTMINRRQVGYVFKEAIRTVRLRLERNQKETGAKVYLISSALPQEGKSTVAVNLALALAERQKNVVLMDMDLRNPSVLKILDYEPVEKGLDDLFKGELTLEDLFVDGIKPNLRILQGNLKEEDVISIITNPKLKDVFTTLRNEADIVIVDTPPSSLLSDASMLAEYADAGIYVSRQDYAPVERIKDGIDMLTDSGLHISGCILNMAKAGLASYGYGYGYGYRYGYGKDKYSYRSKKSEESYMDS